MNQLERNFPVAQNTTSSIVYGCNKRASIIIYHIFLKTLYLTDSSITIHKSDTTL